MGWGRVVGGDPWGTVTGQLPKLVQEALGSLGRAFLVATPYYSSLKVGICHLSTERACQGLSAFFKWPHSTDARSSFKHQGCPPEQQLALGKRGL